MAWCESFAAKVDANTQVLILGSMPGVKSLEDAQYYAHPRNAFWPIIEQLFSVSHQQAYEQRLQQFNAAGLGLWDVYARCFRPGSLDADINKADAQVNDFPRLFQTFPDIRHVFFNGKAAEQAFKKAVGQQHFPNMHFHGLPSTSPAHASLSFADKLQQWQVIKEVMADVT